MIPSEPSYRNGSPLSATLAFSKLSRPLAAFATFSPKEALPSGCGSHHVL